MKQKNFLRISLVLFLVASLGLFTRCSKDDSASDNEEGEIVTPTEVSQNQIVTIEMPSDIEAEQYSGTFNGAQITLMRVGSNAVMFQVPASVVGGADLNVEPLDLNLHYNVNETVLTGTAEEELAPFFEDIIAFSVSIQDEQTEDAAIVNNTITAFNEYYETLSEQEMYQLAVYYKANRELFDSIMNGELNIAGRFNTKSLDFDALTLTKHQLAAIALGGAAVVIWFGTPVEKALGAVVAHMAWKKCKNYLNEIMTSVPRKINISIDNMLSELNRSPQSNMMFVSGEGKSFSFGVQQRNIEAGDAALENEVLNTFFTSHEIFSTAVDKVNDVIEFVNDNLFFSNIDMIPVYTMPSSQPTEIAEGGEVLFEALSFTVSDSNVSLSDISYTEGEINITLNINNPDAVTEEYITTSINYTYQDEMNTINGSFPADVYVETLFPNCGNVTDIDGNSYPTVTIDDKCWMRKNLNVSHYRNGDEIPHVQDLDEWASLTTGAWCYYENNTENGVVYGKLYNWYAVNDSRGLAPEGWHVSSYDDFSALISYLGGPNIASEKLRSVSWGGNATNESGFSAIPGGRVNYNTTTTTFGGLGTYASFWSTYSIDAWEEAGFLSLSINNLTHLSLDYRYGLSVRCVKD